MFLSSRRALPLLNRQIGLVLLVAGWLFLATPGAMAQVAPTSAGRVLAPDTLVVIDPAMEAGETVQGPIDLSLVAEHPELEWTPNEAPKSDTLFERAKGVTFRVPVHCLEFSFKPVRTIETIVQTDQGPEKKLVWYLVYRVRYMGADHNPEVEVPELPYREEIYGKPNTVSVNWVRFMPIFRFKSTGKVEQNLLDQILPHALSAIEARERIGKPLYDSISIQKQKIGISSTASDQAVWGVATWTGIDPRTNFFTIEVTGLTNAQRIVQQGTESEYLQKTLVLNFFRPGDTIDEPADVIRYGVPAVNRVGGLKEILRKAIDNREFELTVVSGLDTKASLADTMREVAQNVSQLGGERIEVYTKTGHLIFSHKDAEPEQKIAAHIQQQLGLQVNVVNRTIPLAEAIRQAERAGDEKVQEEILQQYGLKDRLDHYWEYR